jgi:hypothetical protein
MCNKNTKVCKNCGNCNKNNKPARVPKIGDWVKFDIWDKFYRVTAICDTRLALKGTRGNIEMYNTKSDWIFRDEEKPNLIDRLYDCGFCDHDSKLTGKIDYTNEMSSYYNCNVIDLDDERNLGAMIDILRVATDENYVCDMIIEDRSPNALTVREVAEWYCAWFEVQKLSEEQDRQNKIQDLTNQAKNALAEVVECFAEHQLKLKAFNDLQVELNKLK